MTQVAKKNGIGHRHLILTLKRARNHNALNSYSLGLDDTYNDIPDDAYENNDVFIKPGISQNTYKLNESGITKLLAYYNRHKNSRYLS